jgi:hypothetical protein
VVDGSVHAVTEDGFPLVGSASGSLLAPTALYSKVVDTLRIPCLHAVMPPLEPLTRRRAVDLVRVAAALCPFLG